jgi:hypothetical protein
VERTDSAKGVSDLFSVTPPPRSYLEESNAINRSPYREADSHSVRQEVPSHLLADCLYNVGSLTSHNPIGLHGLLRG